MTIQYQASAAGISWMALCEALRGRAEMQQALLELSSTNTAVQLQMTKVSADDELKQGIDQANGMWYAALGQILGGGFSALSSIGMYKAQTYLYKKATGLTAGNEEIEMDAKKLSSPPASPRAEDVPLVQGGSASIEGQNEKAPVNTVVKKEDSEKEDSESNLTPPQKALHRQARFFDTHGQTLAGAINSAFTSTGSFLNSKWVSQQAADKADQTLQTGLAGIMKAQNDMVSAAISSNDSYSNNTEQAITTIISVSAVRG